MCICSCTYASMLWYIALALSRGRKLPQSTVGMSIAMASLIDMMTGVNTFPTGRRQGTGMDEARGELVDRVWNRRRISRPVLMLFRQMRRGVGGAGGLDSGAEREDETRSLRAMSIDSNSEWQEKWWRCKRGRDLGFHQGPIEP